jgi:hypothetical protein
MGNLFEVRELKTRVTVSGCPNANHDGEAQLGRTRRDDTLAGKQ